MTLFCGDFPTPISFETHRPLVGRSSLSFRAKSRNLWPYFRFLASSAHTKRCLDLARHDKRHNESKENRSTFRLWQSMAATQFECGVCTRVGVSIETRRNGYCGT